MVHILDIFVSIAMSTILFLAGCSDKAVKDNEGNGGSDNDGDEPVERLNIFNYIRLLAIWHRM